MEQLAKNIAEVTWDEVRASFFQTEPVFAKIIDELSPSKDFTLIKISYPFGSLILDKAIVHLPTTGYHSVPLTNPEISNKLKEILGYANFPLGCLINQHGAEIYNVRENSLHSIAFFNQGLNFGIYEFFAPPTPFSISAGARTMMLLPKITDSVGHAALKNYGVTSPPPHSPFEQWYIFREIANYEKFKTPWHCEVVYFTRKWTDKINNDLTWLKLKYFILHRAWEHTEYNRSRWLHDEMWESYSEILSRWKIKPVSYVVDLFKYLIGVSHLAVNSCSLTAYKPAHDEDIAGPIDDLLATIIDVYGLETYVPTLMLPCHFLANDSKDPVYYSLQIPMHWNLSPKSRDSISAKRDLNHLIWLFDNFQHELTAGHIYHNIPKMQQIFTTVNFEFFHGDGASNERIKPASTMPLADKNLLYLPKNRHYGERKFAERSSFVQGCIRISLKDKIKKTT